MLTFETTFQGQEVKGPRGSFWVSPSRDLVYAFPNYITKAFNFLQNKDNQVVKAYYDAGGSDDELVDLAKKLVKFIELGTLQIDEERTVNQSAMEAGLVDLPVRLKEVFGYAMFNVVLSAYYRGVYEANTGKLNPYSLASPGDILAAANGK